MYKVEIDTVATKWINQTKNDMHTNDHLLNEHEILTEKLLNDEYTRHSNALQAKFDSFNDIELRPVIDEGINMKEIITTHAQNITIDMAFKK